jgi:hypothetical protein
MKKILIYLFAIFTLMASFSCSSKKTNVNNDKVVTVFYKGCSDESEVISDLDNSIESNRSFFIKNNIQLKIDTTENMCGYLLKWNKKKKEISSVMTDIDLQTTVNEFFAIK